MVSDDEIKKLVELVKVGDLTARESLILLHLHLAVFHARKQSRKWRRYRDEYFSEAYLALVEAVDAGVQVNDLESIGAYINVYIRHTLKRVPSECCVVRIPYSSLKSKGLTVIKVSELEHDPVSHKEEPDLFAILVNDEDRRIISMKLGSSTEKEIADELGKSVSYVRGRLKKMRESI